MDYIVAENVRAERIFEARNVIKKRTRFHFSQMEKELELFLETIDQAGGHPDGPVVYSLNNIPYDGYMDIEFFLPLKEEYLDIEGMNFSSYFEVQNMIMITMQGDYEELTKVAYARLLWTLEQNDQAQNTPFYHILDTTGSGSVTVLLGYAY